jgi:hypothetical protein
MIITNIKVNKCKVITDFRFGIADFRFYPNSLKNKLCFMFIFAAKSDPDNYRDLNLKSKINNAGLQVWRCFSKQRGKS